MSKLCFLFPGQGSQYLGMGKSLYENDEQTREYWQKAEAALGYHIADKVFNGSDEELKNTELLQPALFMVSYTVAKYLEKKLIVPDFVAGHSLGEYSAAAFAGVIDFEDAVKLIAFRGKVMKQAADNKPGAMAAVIGMEYEKIDSLCKVVTEKIGKYVGPANFNSPSQIVISGFNESVEEFIKMAENDAKKIVKLPVSGAFHSLLMSEAKEKLADYFSKIDFKAPKYSIAMNATGEICNDVNIIKENLLAQTTGCVLWTKVVENLVKESVTIGLECGPGKVLRGLLRSINRAVKVTSVESYESIEKYLEK